MDFGPTAAFAVDLCDDVAAAAAKACASSRERMAAKIAAIP
jgi:hypothetical protein